MRLDNKYHLDIATGLIFPKNMGIFLKTPTINLTIRFSQKLKKLIKQDEFSQKRLKIGKYKSNKTNIFKNSKTKNIINLFKIVTRKLPVAIFIVNKMHNLWFLIDKTFFIPKKYYFFPKTFWFISIDDSFLPKTQI